MFLPKTAAAVWLAAPSHSIPTQEARWRKTIQYDKGLLAATRAHAAVTVYYGGTYSNLCATEATPTVTGNWATFKGWYTEYLGEGTEITADMTVDNDAPRIVYGYWELAYNKPGEIGDIVLKTGKCVTAENYAAGTNDYNWRNGGTQASSGAEFSSTVVGVVCASGWMIEPKPNSSTAYRDSAKSAAEAVKKTNYESGWSLPSEATMKSILNNKETIESALNTANAKSGTTYIQSGNYWIQDTTADHTYMKPDTTTAKPNTNPKYYYCAVHALP